MNRSRPAFSPHDDCEQIPNLGAILRESRHARKLSLQELSARAGVSVGMISQIERNLANPSARVLMALREALQIEMATIFNEAPALGLTEARDPDFVRRASKRPFLELETLRKELLTSGGTHDLQIMILHIRAEGHSGTSTLRFSSEKAGLVLYGALLLTVDGQETLLLAGDSFAFDGSKGHAFRNPTKDVTQVVWIICAKSTLGA